MVNKSALDEALTDPASFNFESFETAARRIVERARADADAEIQRAKAEIDKMRTEIRGQEFEAARKQGYDKGYEEGVARGKDDGRQQAHKQHLEELRIKTGTLPGVVEKIAATLEERHKQMLEDAERDLLALSFAIGEKLTRLRIDTDPRVVKKTLDAAIDLVLSRNALDIFVAENDVMAINEYLPELRKVFTDIGAVRLHPDPAMTPGSILVRSGRGEVALRIEERIDAIARELLGMTARDVRDVTSRKTEVITQPTRDAR